MVATKLWFFPFMVFVCSGSIHEDRLLKDLFSRYNSAARPVINDRDAVNVTLGMTLYQIVDVHEKSQTFKISAFIRQSWQNQILIWNPDHYNGITFINVDPKTIWRPDIVLYNNADEDKAFGGNLDRMNTRAIIKYDGQTTWLAPIIFTSQCAIDVKYFPFDTQKCYMKFGSWTYNDNSLYLDRETPSADINKFSPNSEWNLVSANCERNEEEYVCCPGVKYSDVTFYFVLARRSLFFLCNLIFPMTLIGMLTILSFLLPAESGERISLAITLLLAMTVFMLVVADIIPATSDVIPLVGIFFSASMIEMVVMIVVLCWIMRLYHKGDGDAPMGPWMRKYIYNWLSYKVYIRPTENAEDDRTINKQRKQKHDEASNALMSNNNNPHHPDINMTITNQLKNNQPTYGWRYTGGAWFSRQEGYDFRPTEAQILISKLQIVIEKMNSNDQAEQVKKEWRTVAMTIDRCLVVFFSVVYFLTLVGCFSIAPGYVP